MSVFKDEQSNNLSESIIYRKLSLIGFLLFIIGLVSTLGILIDSIFNNLVAMNFVLSLFFLSLLIIVFLGSFYIINKINTKIETTKNGIVVHNFFVKKFYPWSDINSINTKTILLDNKSVLVETKLGKFTFNLTMKDISKEYPKLSQDFKYGNCWVDENCKTKPISAENCELFQIIKENLAQQTN